MSAEETNQFNVQGYNIVTILKRLEAATSRLEDITIFQQEAAKERPSEPAAQKSIESKQADAAAAPPQKAVQQEKAKSVVAFEQFYKSIVEPFVTKSKEIDPLVAEAAESLSQSFAAQITFLDIVSKAKKPEMSDPAFLEILNPINEKISKIIDLKDKNRRSEYFNHLNTISEGSPVLGWIVTETPVSLIPEFKDSAKFWSDRVLKEYKQKDAKHVEWVKDFSNIFDELKTYVKEFHSTGPSWNLKGKPISEVIGEVSKDSKSSAPAPAAGGAPPPPPPPPPPALFEDQPKPEGGINAVFADLNKGENITSGLKKVDKSEMTHKNPELRKQATVPVSKKPSPPKKPSNLSTSTPPKKKPAKTTLVDGTKWIVENYTEADIPDQKPITLEAEMHQSIYIGNCTGITVQIKGKANAISISETKNTGVVVDSLISGVDIIKSFKFGLQVTGVVPMISVDKSDEGSIYLSKESVEADTQIFTSSTTALNVNVPEGDDDYAELAIPEQFKHSIRNGKLVSEVVEHAG
ncbi:adenylate cyclase-associated protein [Suhomyces tanzawaensis NRRL Y-17324]|uniref:Adenylyl cyclase-associated protein n=1 Tax=Suhomyces tanzawaensis NRRL Y-17324 TaxID=984487 RepID=A0A1E4SKD3_9ASCO|nr:adenylate cyclase-associated protein [Suhomyces tanzawaensis NRRL Y-17324]ODV79975.1 adenylate cyclase-associated protein [Suhomyces tanzawaensis NRRL Y-17324]